MTLSALEGLVPELLAARRRLEGVAHRTPVFRSTALDDEV